MSYNDIADMAQDGLLQRRVTACAWSEDITADPGVWASQNSWRISAQPGWAEAWASAKLANTENIGANESVITDNMILSAVQAIAPVETP